MFTLLERLQRTVNDMEMIEGLKTERADYVVEWLAKETGSRDTALRMVRTAFGAGLSLDYPVPVVTVGKNGIVGVKLGRGTTLICGYSLAVGDRDREGMPAAWQQDLNPCDG